MQIIPQDDQLVFVSENPLVDEKNKVQTFKWTDIERISFVYPVKNIWRILRNVIEVVIGFFGGADLTNTFAKTITIDIKLKTGDKISNEFNAYSIKQGQQLEKELLKHLKR